jgi:uncharacterized protein (DUF779 family)
VKDTEEAIHVNVEKIPVDISGAQGMTWAHGKLYAHVTGGGLFTATDTNNDGMLDVDLSPFFGVFFQRFLWVF